jgi:hypothetical protein
VPHSIPNRETLSYRVETSRRRLAEAIDVIHQMKSASPEKPALQDVLTELCEDLRGLNRDIEAIRDQLDYGTTPRLHHFHVPFQGSGPGDRPCEIPFTD